MVKAIILMADYGHDPTETAVPYSAFKDAGFHVTFATEAGKPPECDDMMLRGMTRLLLGATAVTVEKYDAMASSPEWKTPLAWSDASFNLTSFDLVFLPGGHEKSVRQIIDSPIVHSHLVTFFPLTAKVPPSSASSPPSAGLDSPNSDGGGAGTTRKVVGAVCHGVMVLSEAKDEQGHSPIRTCDTTALPARFEQLAFWGTRAFLGDYYKTYGAGSEDVEDSVRNALERPGEQFKCSLSPAPFVVEDDRYNYVSARFPGDVQLMSERLVRLAQG